MSVWTVTMLPVKQKDVSGLKVLLTDGDEQYEVGRVAFVRQQSVNKDKSFEEQLDAVLTRADNAAMAVNELVDELERSQRIAEQERREKEAELAVRIREKVREALGSEPQKVMT